MGDFRRPRFGQRARLKKPASPDPKGPPRAGLFLCADPADPADPGQKPAAPMGRRAIAIGRKRILRLVHEPERPELRQRVRLLRRETLILRHLLKARRLGRRHLAEPARERIDRRQARAQSFDRRLKLGNVKARRDKLVARRLLGFQLGADRERQKSEKRSREAHGESSRFGDPSLVRALLTIG